MKPTAVVIESPKTDSRIFAHTRWDALPVLAAIFHCVYFFGMFHLFARVPLWIMLILGFIYSVSISWNINGISHNFIHNPYFRSPLLNRLFSILESITVGFSQVFYECIHMQHHKGNADRPDENGETVKNPRDAFWGVTELTLFASTFVILGVLNWRYICFLVPFWYFGHCLSYLNGYYRHYGGNPDEPLAWAVISYDKLYNWIWFFNGYHAEHHFRPKVHWTRMQALRDQIVVQQHAAGVRVIKPPHALAFLDPDLPTLKQNSRQRSRVRWNLRSARLQRGAN